MLRLRRTQIIFILDSDTRTVYYNTIDSLKKVGKEAKTCSLDKSYWQARFYKNPNSRLF